MKSSILICIVPCFASLLTCLGSEVLLNGNFEFSFPEPGMPNYWKGNTGDANLKSTANVSPFTNIYPTGKNAVMIADGPSNNIYPILVQPFLPSVAEFSFSFDFYLAAVSDAPWKIRIGGNVTANLDFFINSANSFEFAGATRGTVASLTGGTWYQLDSQFFF